MKNNRLALIQNFLDVYYINCNCDNLYCIGNVEYKKLISDKEYDEEYKKNVIKSCQSKIDFMQENLKEEDCYISYVMKDIILDYLDEINIHPDDINYIISQLKF